MHHGLLVAWLTLAATIRTDFEGGSLGRIERVSEAHFRCALAGDVDQDKRNRQANWYYFRVEGARGPLTIDLIDLPGEYNYRPNRGAVTKDTIPVYSEDDATWKHFGTVEYDSATPYLRLRITPRTDQLWIAHVPPYTNRHLEALLASVAGLRVETIGKSVQGRDLRLLTVSDPAPDAAKKVIWLMFRQHAWEAGSSWACDGALRFLLSDDTTARRIRRETVFKIFPLCDPDGVARGSVRFNVHGYDLNRNWDVADPQRMPEIAAQRKAVLDWVDSGRRVDLFVTLHNTETAEYLEGPPGYDSLTERFYRALRDLSTFTPTRPPRSTEPTAQAGRMTVVQGLWRDRKIPAFLIEQMIARNPRLGRLPTIDDRRELGVALVRATWTAATAKP